jgi:hypothetical protein
MFEKGREGEPMKIITGLPLAVYVSTQHSAISVGPVAININ